MSEKVIRAITSLSIAIVQVVAVTWFYSEPLIVYPILLLSTGILLWIFSFSKPYVTMFVVTAVSGFLAEAIVVTQGAWMYATQDILQLPYWLLLLWGSVGVVIMFSGHQLIERYAERKN